MRGLNNKAWNYIAHFRRNQMLSTGAMISECTKVYNVINQVRNLNVGGVRSDLPTASSKALDISNVNCDCRLSFFTTVWCAHPYCPPTVYMVTIRTIVQTVRTMGHFHLLSIPLWPTEGAIDGLGNLRGRGSLSRPFFGGQLCQHLLFFNKFWRGNCVGTLSFFSWG